MQFTTCLAAQKKSIRLLCRKCRKEKFVCKKCGKYFYENMNISGKQPPDICPFCKGQETRRHWPEEKKKSYSQKRSAISKNMRKSMEKEQLAEWYKKISIQKNTRTREEIERSNRKTEKTKQKKYGDPFYNNPEKYRRTCIEKYGIDCFRKSLACVQKIKATKRERYGDANYNNRLKYEQTCLEKYGVRSSNQVKEIIEKQQRSSRSNYCIDNLIFDSKEELCFYSYCKNLGLDIKREPVALKYLYESKEYFYYPDFQVNSELYEIKGEQFIGESQIWKNPYNPEDQKPAAKYWCAIENNVKIIPAKECQIYIGYCLDKFGGDFIKKHTRRKN